MKIPKIIALDIDGTLFDSKGKISQRTLKAIHACTQAGINVVFSTGRDYDSLPLAETEGSGIAMGNAPTDIKRYADEVTLSNDEDGVAVVLERILSLI